MGTKGGDRQRPREKNRAKKAEPGGVPGNKQAKKRARWKLEVRPRLGKLGNFLHSRKKNDLDQESGSGEKGVKGGKNIRPPGENACNKKKVNRNVEQKSKPIIFKGM